MRSLFFLPVRNIQPLLTSVNLDHYVLCATGLQTCRLEAACVCVDACAHTRAHHSIYCRPIDINYLVGHRVKHKYDLLTWIARNMYSSLVSQGTEYAAEHFCQRKFWWISESCVSVSEWLWFDVCLIVSYNLFLCLSSFTSVFSSSFHAFYFRLLESCKSWFGSNALTHIHRQTSFLFNLPTSPSLLPSFESMYDRKSVV